MDAYSLLDRGEAGGSYSARSLADNVWARHRASLEIDLGANGANPLNNTPFIGKTRIDEITGVRNRQGWAGFLECMEAVKALRSAGEARRALRGFILARTRGVLATVPVDPKAGDAVAVSAIIAAIDAFAAESSESGRRAQVCAAAFLDASFGEDRVVVKGYHANETMADLAEMGVRSYVAEPRRGRRDWQGKPEARDAVYANRRRLKGGRGRRLMRKRGELIERGFAHQLETGDMRRTHLRGHENILSWSSRSARRSRRASSSVALTDRGSGRDHPLGRL